MAVSLKLAFMTPVVLLLLYKVWTILKERKSLWNPQWSNFDLTELILLKGMYFTSNM